MKYIGALVGMGLVCIASWLAGFDFDRRGDMAIVTFLFALLGGLIGGTFGIEIRLNAPNKN